MMHFYSHPKFHNNWILDLLKFISFNDVSHFELFKFPKKWEIICGSANLSEKIKMLKFGTLSSLDWTTSVWEILRNLRFKRASDKYLRILLSAKFKNINVSNPRMYLCLYSLTSSHLSLKNTNYYSNEMNTNQYTQYQPHSCLVPIMRPFFQKRWSNYFNLSHKYPQMLSAWKVIKDGRKISPWITTKVK